MKMNIRLLNLSIVLLSLSPVLIAQDTRNVTEPVLPPVCAVLKAQLSAGAGGIAAGDEAKLDTERIQKAIDGCAKGHSVELRAQGENDALLTGPLQLRQGVTLIVGKGVTLFASRDPAVYDTTPGSCGVMLPNEEPALSDPIDAHLYATYAGCKPLILADRVSDAGVMGDGVIDGRGNAKMLGKDISWWELGLITNKAHHDVPMLRYCFRLIMAHHADNFTLYRITLKNAPQFNVSYDHGDGFTVWGIKIDTPEKVDGKKTAPNTDGIDPGNGSKNITITHSYIRDGDDNVAFTGSLTNATVSHNHFYWGHGVSIGSIVTKAGVSKIRVYDLTLDGTDSGIRVKSSSTRGGLVHDVVYDDVCVRDSPNPINFYTNYGSYAGIPLFPDYGPTMLPEFRDITLRNVRVSGGGGITFSGYSREHRVGVNLDGVMLIDSAGAKYTYTIDHADIHLGPGPVNLQVNGEDSTVSGEAGSGSLASCAEKFVPFPE
jgi:polygalacturonase